MLYCYYCSTPAISFCTCTNPPTLTCQPHIHSQSTPHKPSPLFQTISKSQKEKISKICFKRIKKIERISIKSIKALKDLISEVEELFFKFNSNLSSLKNSYIQLITYLSTESKVCVLENDDKVQMTLIDFINKTKVTYPRSLTRKKILETLIIKTENFDMEKIKNIENDEKITISQIFYNKEDEIAKTSQILKYTENENIRTSQIHVSTENEIIRASQISVKTEDEIMRASQIRFKTEDENIVIPWPCSSKIAFININTSTTKILNANSTHGFPYAYGFCKVSESKILIYGGTFGIISSRPFKFLMSVSTFLVDTEALSITEMRNFEKKSDMNSGAFVDGFVFVFGGFYEDCSQTKSGAKFNVDRNIWSNICNLPKSLGYCCSTSINNKIFIAGKDSETIYRYNTLNDNFDEFFSAGLGSKIFLSSATSSFLIFQNQVYLYLDHWSLINQIISIEDCFLVAPTASREGFIYFLVGKYNIEDGKIFQSSLLRLCLENINVELVSKNLF